MTLRRKAYCRDTAWEWRVGTHPMAAKSPKLGIDRAADQQRQSIFLSARTRDLATEACGGWRRRKYCSTVFQNLPEISEADGTVQKLYPYWRIQGGGIKCNYIITGLN
ncbi:MAG: hypothetical protein R3D56_13460 [Paracoccaceae bacterium]